MPISTEVIGFPLDAICDQFPHNVDQRLDTVQGCFSKVHLSLVQALYGGGQYKEPELKFELVANMPGMTALMLAAYLGDVPAARLLLRRGASVGLVNCYGRTSLMLACMRGHEEIVKLLLSVDVPTDVVDTSGRDSITWADERGHTRVAILVRAAAHARRDWRMAQLQERSKFRQEQQQQRRRPSNVACEMPHDVPKAGTPHGLRSGSARPLSGRSRTPCAYAETTHSSRQLPMSSKKAIAQKMGPIGLGVLSSRGLPRAASNSSHHCGSDPILTDAPTSVPELEP